MERENKKELLELVIGLHATKMLLSYQKIFFTAIRLIYKSTEVYQFSPFSKVFKLENELIVVGETAFQEKRDALKRYLS